MSMTARSRRYLEDAARAFERAPAEVTAAVVLAIAFSYAVAEGGEMMRAWLAVAVSAALIVAAAWTGTMLHGLGAWSPNRRWAVTAAGALATALYAWLVLDLERAGEGWRAFMLVAAAVLWLTAVPAFAARHTGTHPVRLTREVNGRVLLRVIGALLYCGALFAGLALALGAVDTLFELNLDGDIYGHVFGWTFLVLAPWIVAGGVPDYVRAGGDGSAVANVAHRMIAFLIPPLLALYCLILYAYAVRIGITGEVPKNLVSPMVLAAGVLATLSLFLFADRADVSASYDAGPDGSMTRWLRYAPPLFMPLALLGVWALWLRVDQYGWTEFRMLRVIVLLALAGLAVGATVLLFRRRRYPLHVVPLTLAAVLALAAVGPWSVLAISERSQYSRLVANLAAVGIQPNDEIEPVDVAAAPDVNEPADLAGATSPRSVPPETYEQINSGAQYLVTHFGSDALPPVLAGHADSRYGYYDIAASIGLQPAWPDTVDGAGFGGHFAEGTSVRMRGATVHRINVTPERNAVISGAVAMRQDSATLTFTIAGETLHADLGPLLDAERPVVNRRPVTPGMEVVPMPRPLREGGLTGAELRLDLIGNDGTRRGDLLILHVMMFMQDGALQLRQMDGLVIVDDRG